MLLPTAIAAYRAGRHADAQAVCGRILDDLTDHFDALHLLGVSELDCGRFDEAEKVLARAVGVDPRSAEANSNLGLAHYKLKRNDEARKCQEKAVALKPNFPTAWTNLGNALMRLRLYDKAIEAHDRAIRQKPDYADAFCNRGMAELLLDRTDQADQSFAKALSLQPRLPAALVGKGIVHLNRRHFDAAQAAFDAALALQPNAAEIHAHRGRLLQQMGLLGQAEAAYDRTLALDSDSQAALNGKAQIALLSGDVARAIALCTRTLAQNPDSHVALSLLGLCHAKQGDAAGAIDLFDRSLSIKPDYEEAIVNRIFTLDFMPEADFAAHQAARKLWWDAIGARLPQRQLAPTTLDPDRRIVVGYVSSDFRGHSAAIGFMPVLRHHDHEAFEIIAYSCSPLRDDVTEQCRALVDQWVDASRLSDDELADRIQADRVDILVDLAGHSAGNRLTVFASKPAPVQVTAWGSATGTGLPTMDHLFADRVNIPVSVRHLFAEKIHELPCVITTEALPGLQPSTLPLLRNGHVTFGVFNRIDKISNSVLALWSRLLREVDGARIVIKNGALDDALLRDGLIARFAALGVTRDRVKCLGSTSRPEHLAAFAGIDISLDPFPQNGGVSTWESLQAGVPVVTRLGNSVASRAGGAIVTAVGLDDWVADDDESYLAIARKFAAMPAALAALRVSLPAMVAASAAGDGATYTRRVEEGYRQFWRDHCRAQASS
ncbi:MAG: tetratricopeptide repeat protein [Bradyrhizobium sp.]|nr:tetratricopeptide repeat protein [Bradyrhizobium sp.]